MVEIGHGRAERRGKGRSRRCSVPDLPFRPGEPAAGGVEVLRLEDLERRVAPGHLQRVHRPAFHHLVHVEAGTLRPTVDFTEHTVGRGNWLWTRPGQVHRWGDLHRVTGTMVLFRHESVDAATAVLVGVHEPEGPTMFRPAGAPARGAAEALSLLRSVAAGTEMEPVASAAAVRHLLAVVLLHLVGGAGVGAGGLVDPADPFVAFRRAVEADFARTRRVEDYAERLGWSVRTLSRATHRATSMSAKELVDRRVILEAERLLAHTDLSAARIGARLGFESATNFGKFFLKHTGVTPGAFRSTQRPDR